MLKSIDYKRNNKTEVIKINLKKINYIYGANGTGNTTTSTGYANRESEGIYTFNQEFINNNLFSPSPINGTMIKINLRNLQKSCLVVTWLKSKEKYNQLIHT